MSEAFRLVKGGQNLAQMSEEEYAQCRSLLFKLSGIILSDSDAYRVSHCINRQREASGSSTFGQYFDLLSDPHNVGLRADFVDALAQQSGDFFRYELQIDLMLKRVKENLGNRSGAKVWVTSSGSGEDVYSIAMAMADTFSFDADWSVLGTDESHQMIFRSRTGIYRAAQAQHMPATYHSRFCEPNGPEKMMMCPELHGHVQFRQFDLKSQWSRVDKFDLIYLQNKLPFFDREERNSLLKKLHSQLNTKGYIVLGRTEAISLDSNLFSFLAPSIYQRVD